MIHPVVLYPKTPLVVLFFRTDVNSRRNLRTAILYGIADQILKDLHQTRVVCPDVGEFVMSQITRRSEHALSRFLDTLFRTALQSTDCGGRSSRSETCV